MLYVFKFHNFWVEGALESAIRNIVNIFPIQYEKEFGHLERRMYDGNQTCLVNSEPLKITDEEIFAVCPGLTRYILFIKIFFFQCSC